MFANQMRPVHPGEVLLENYIKPAGQSASSVAEALGITPMQLDEITKGERDITADIALRLERHFGSDAQGWMNLQSTFASRKAAVASQAYPSVDSFEGP